MPISQPELDALNLELRDWAESLSSPIRAFMIQTLTVTFGYASTRTVQLWFSKGTERRPMLTFSKGKEELERRLNLAYALLETFPITQVQKEATMHGSAAQCGRKLSIYLDNDYTRKAINRVYFDLGFIQILYDSYSTESDSVDDDDEIDV